MSETENTTPSEDVTAESAPPKKSFLKLIIIAVVLLAVGGGGYYFWHSRAAADDNEDVAESNEKPEKSSSKKSKAKKQEEDDSEDEAATSSKKTNALKAALPNDEAVKKVIELPPFIVNLADTDNARYLRMTVSLGVGGEEGGESEKPDQLFMTRIRNAMLAVLAEKKSEEILTPEGKATLRKELLKAAKAASEEPHVEAIYITDFIVQL